MYAKGATAAEAAQFGLTLEEAQGDAVEIWPDNMLAVNCFIGMSTQWRVGMSGATGLDYNALPFVMRSTGVKPADRNDVFADLRILEDEALAVMRESQK